MMPERMVRVLLNQKQLEAIVLLIDQALEMDSFTEGEIDLEDTNHIITGLANALSQISGDSKHLRKYDGLYLPGALPPGIEIIYLEDFPF